MNQNPSSIIKISTTFKDQRFHKLQYKIELKFTMCTYNPYSILRCRPCCHSIQEENFWHPCQKNNFVSYSFSSCAIPSADTYVLVTWGQEELDYMNMFTIHWISFGVNLLENHYVSITINYTSSRSFDIMTLRFFSLDKLITNGVTRWGRNGGNMVTKINLCPHNNLKIFWEIN